MYLWIKRFFDIISSFLVLVLISPLLFVIMLILRFTGEGEVFYRQKRIGLKNKPFGIWKFATMVKNSVSIGAGDVTLRNDPRVTPFGRFLRMTKINEVPQLFNVLSGDMSLVGPRPLMPDGFNRYSSYIRERIYDVMPGLTGIGSIVFRDEEEIVSKSHLSPHECYEQVIMPYKGELELWYHKHQSLTTDFLLLMLTAWYIFNPGSKLVFKVFKDLPKWQVQVI